MSFNSLTDENPVASMAAMGATFQMFHFLFARTITALGDLPPDKIVPPLFEGMYQKDMTYLMDLHNELNDMDVKLPGMEETTDAPLASSSPPPSVS
jgi:hypothetical protein